MVVPFIADPKRPSKPRITSMSTVPVAYLTYVV